MEQFQVLDIKKVFESPLNPRRSFNEKKMEELIESVKAKGILMPLLVRPTDDGRYEIAAGHRRYRAAIKLKLTKVPIVIREMIDSDFLEVLAIENLQREDIEPLDEAQGYRTLMEKTNYDVAAIAGKVGKSASYIYQRMKLLDLIPEAQEQLAKEKITAGHAILIARLQPNEQKECLEAIEKESDYGPGMSVRNLADYIERQIHLDLNSASFKKADPNLVPEAGPCTTCRKRTGFVPELFPEISKKDTCTDPTCFQKKVDAYMGQWIHDKSQDSDVSPLRLSGNYDSRTKKVPDDPMKPIPSQLYHVIKDTKKDGCSSAREGIITEGQDRGRVLNVCTDRKCKKHHGTTSSSSQHDEYKAEQKAAEEKRRQEKTFRLRIIDTIVKGIKEIDKADLAFVASQLYDELWNEYQKDILQRHDLKPLKVQYGFNNDPPMKEYIKGCSAPDLGRLLMEMALIRHQERPNSQKVDPLLETAKRHGVNVKAIEAEMKQEIKERAKAKAKEKAAKDKKKSPSVKQKPKRKDPPDVTTIAMKDICKLHAPTKKKGSTLAKEVRIPANQELLAMAEKSYSGDLLANGGDRIREPFEWEGDSYVCLACGSSGAEGIIQVEVWRVMPADLFEGKTYNYDGLKTKWDHDEKERGNHHGLRVGLGKKSYVLDGPSIIFYAEKKPEKPKTGVCQVCGCTKKTPCIDPTFLTPCAWADKEKTLCTACQRKSKEHQWEKQNLVTVASTRKVPMHDIYKCKTCGATAKRFGISEFIRRDKKFATWEQCPGPKKDPEVVKAKEIPCLNCVNDTDNGGNCTRENFYETEAGDLVCDSRKLLQTAAKKKGKGEK